ncbi:UNVERIFIED_CONTAM: hypothetical protein GTU68_065746 [Idotea baltica]|nr:hypothetical protein [Idotea baltica]
MPIEGVFSISGRGTVVTGRVEQGILNVNDDIEILGLNKDIKTTCTGIEMFHKEMSIAEAGENVGLLLRGVNKKKVFRGQVASAPEVHKAYSNFIAKVYILTHKEGGRRTPFYANFKPQFFIRTADITGSFTFSSDIVTVMPGDTAELQINLISPVALNTGVRFTIREGKLTIGTGVVSKVL